MDTVVSAFAQFVGVNDYLLGKALEGLSEDELRRHPRDANPMGWVVGHIVHYRNQMAKAIGGGLDLPWASAFEQHSQPDEGQAFPVIADLKAALQATSADLKARLAQLTDAELSAPAPRPFPIPDKTMRGMVAFLVYHEAYHVGQVAYVKKWLGHPGIVDGH